MKSSPAATVLPGAGVWLGFVVGGAAVGILAALRLIFTGGIGFARWGGVVWLSVAVYVPFVVLQAAVSYAVLGILGRVTRKGAFHSVPFKLAFSVTVAGLVLPLAVGQNLRRPGFSMSLYHLGPHALLLLTSLMLAALAGIVFAWLSAKSSGPFVRTSVRRLSSGILGVLGLGALQIAANAALASGSDRGRETLAGPDLPNAVLITVDTLRTDHLQSYGYAKPTDPEIQRHFGDGLRFTDAVCQVPVTRPSHAAMLTGIHPAVLGMRWNERPLPQDVPTLAEQLREHGYDTAAFVGAWPLFGQRSGLDRGFEHYSDVFSPVLAVDRRMDELPVLMILRKLGLLDTLERNADSVTDAALSWVRRPRTRPFFLWVHYYDPHSPYEPPMEFAEPMGTSRDGARDTRGLLTQVALARNIDPSDAEQAKALYDGEIRFVDAAVGRLLDEIGAQGLQDRTVVLLTADHGETLFEKAQSEKLAFTHGRWLKEWDLRVPFFIRGPGIPPGVEDRRTAQSMDVMPTLLAALGLPTPENAMGRNLLEPPVEQDSKPVLAFNSPFAGYPMRVSARTSEYKLILEPDTGVEYLYHLPSDPREENNLASELPDIAKSLRVFADALPAVSRVEQAPDPAELDRLRALGYVR